MRPAVLLLSSVAAAALIAGALALRRHSGSAPAAPEAMTAAPSEIAPPPTAAERPPPDSSLGPASGLSTEDIFRRAFWRHPTPADHILHAERREAGSAGNAGPDAWQWFLVLHPGPDLLAALRNPETFGLTPARDKNAPRTVVPDLPPPPAWFVAVGSADFEVLQASTGGLTVFYRATDNLLYATDHGQGFAAPARPL